MHIKDAVINLGLAAGAGTVAAAADWKVLAASAFGTFSAFLLHRTFSTRDMRRIAREEVRGQLSVSRRVLEEVMTEAIKKHEGNCALKPGVKECP